MIIYGDPMIPTLDKLESLIVDEFDVANVEHVPVPLSDPRYLDEQYRQFFKYPSNQVTFNYVTVL